jgi:hypothetical protein
MSNFKRGHLEVFRFRKDECQVPQTGCFKLRGVRLDTAVIIDKSRPLIVC